MKKFNKGLIVMRGQPLHNGHKSLIDLMLKECKKSYIILGSIQESRTEKNPFTFEERKQMIKNVYGSSVFVDGMEDMPNNNEAWLDGIMKKIDGYPDAYYCGDNINGDYFKVGNIVLRMLPRDKQEGFSKISATKIRELIREKNNFWKCFVPKENHKYIEQIVNLS